MATSLPFSQAPQSIRLGAPTLEGSHFFWLGAAHTQISNISIYHINMNSNNRIIDACDITDSLHSLHTVFQNCLLNEIFCLLA